jgi:hydroxypyruvate reductase
VDAALRACDPRVLLSRALDRHPLPGSSTVSVVAAGKAAEPMMEAFVARYGPRIRARSARRGGHPLPNEESVKAGEEALRLADESRARGELFVLLLSGGASAMLEGPAEGVTLDRLVSVTKDLLRSGRPIDEINAQRKQMSAIKGGKLAVRAGRSITYAISDVHAPVEDDPTVIGSAPTVLADDGRAKSLGPSVLDAQFVLAGSRRDAMGGARAEAARLGYQVRLIDPPTLGEAREAARRFVVSIANDGSPGLQAGGRLAVIGAGETTVALPPGSRGKGGRNQEFGLAAALALADSGPNLDLAKAIKAAYVRGDWALASVGTDGIDGPTDAAGAIVDATTLSRAAAAGLDPVKALASHDSYPFFEQLGDLVITGPTGTNVGDLQVFLAQLPPNLP